MSLKKYISTEEMLYIAFTATERPGKPLHSRIQTSCKFRKIEGTASIPVCHIQNFIVALKRLQATLIDQIESTDDKETREDLNYELNEYLYQSECLEHTKIQILSELIQAHNEQVADEDDLFYENEIEYSEIRFSDAWDIFIALIIFQEDEINDPYSNTQSETDEFDEFIIPEGVLLN